MRREKTAPTISGGLRPIRILIVVALAVVVAPEPSAAVPEEGGAVAQQVAHLPALDADFRGWSGPLAPLPLWAQVFIVSSGLLGAFFFVRPAVRILSRTLRPKGKHL